MKNIKLAKTILSIITVFFITYNSIFGWNNEPINEAEKLCDAIMTIGVWVVCVLYLKPLAAIYEKFIKEIESE